LHCSIRAYARIPAKSHAGETAGIAVPVIRRGRISATAAARIAATVTMTTVTMATVTTATTTTRTRPYVAATITTNRLRTVKKRVEQAIPTTATAVSAAATIRITSIAHSISTFLCI
jgi:hypothetical protein